MNTYLSWFEWQRSVTNLEWLSLVGNTGRLGTTLVGATTLTLLLPTTVALNPYDLVTIFDGSNSENVTVSALVNPGAISIPCSATIFAHAAGIPYATDGVSGSLAEQIIRASQLLETLCKQTLFLNTYTNEELALPTMRASIDNQYALHFRPRHWPIQSLTALSIAPVPGFSMAYDPTQAFIDSDRQICSLPNLQPLPLSGSGQAPYPIWNVTNRYKEAQVTISYIAGFSTIPADVTEAAVLLTSDILAKRENPIGALDLGSGVRHISAAIRGETTGDSLLFKRAKKILDNYTVQAF